VFVAAIVASSSGLSSSCLIFPAITLPSGPAVVQVANTVSGPLTFGAKTRSWFVRKMSPPSVATRLFLGTAQPSVPLRRKLSTATALDAPLRGSKSSP
jgi:hypothetical protein